MITSTEEGRVIVDNVSNPRNKAQYEPNNHGFSALRKKQRYKWNRPKLVDENHKLGVYCIVTS